MVQLNKILCFLFTILVICIINQQCEGMDNIDSFDNCIDDPNWYTMNEDGQRLYCADIGDNASCYDRDLSQREGWERCLKTCGNCADTQVTLAPQNNLAMFSGDPVEDFGVVMFIDDDRKWFGVGVGDEVVDEETGEVTYENDVRSSLSDDQGEDISNLYNRVSLIEDLYDMLLGSVSQCIDCNSHDNDEITCNNTTGCTYDSDLSVCLTDEVGGDNFISCNGSQLSCTYDLPEIDPDDENNDDSGDDDDGDNSNTDTSDQTYDEVVRSYVKHECSESGTCNIMFPIYEMNCNQIPEPENDIIYQANVTYNPTTDGSCLTAEYVTENATQIEPVVNHQCLDSEGSIIANCYKYDTSDHLNIVGECNQMCKSNNANYNYFSVTEDSKCYCFENDPSESIVECGVEGSEDNNYLYNDGETVTRVPLNVTPEDDDESIRTMCKSYFLLDTSLTGEDSTTDGTDEINSLTGRISLFDMCPSQCRAEGCSE